MSNKICIFGSGFVGQATGKGLAKHGNEVVFVDINQDKVDNLRREGFKAYTESEHRQNDYDIIMFCLPTPTENDAIVLKHIKDGAKHIGKQLKDYITKPTIVVRSTVLPGTTRNIVLPLLEKHSGKKVGAEFFINMQPEFLRQATANQDFERPWYILIGEYDKASGDVLDDLYSPFNAPIERMTIEEAEMQKYVHNLYNAVKIAFFNEMRLIAHNEEWDSEKIFEAVAQSCEGIWNPLYGLRDYGPFDGFCLPKDTSAFINWAQSKKHKASILGAAISQNKRFAEHYHNRIKNFTINPKVMQELPSA